MKKLFALCLAVLMVLSLAACGGSKTAADGKKWIIASDTVFKPFEYTDASGNFVGIDVDILAAIAEDQGFTYTLNSLGWDAAIAACQAGQADGMIAGASITEERKASGWIFSDGYFDATQCMTVSAGSDIAYFDDLAGKTVAVKTGTQGAAYAEILKDQYGFTLTYFDDSSIMYQDVLTGNSVACFEDYPVMSYGIQQGNGLKIVTEEKENYSTPYGFAVMKGQNQDLLEAFDKGLKELKSSGDYEKIVNKYLA